MKPWTDEYCESDKRILRVWSGIVTVKDILDAHQDIKNHINDGKIISSILSDFSNVTEFNVYAKDVHTVAETDIIISEKLPKISFAIVAPDPVIFGSIRSWQVFSEGTGWTTEVFKSIDKAEVWLKESFPARPC